MFDVACTELRVDCSDLPPPKVIYTKDIRMLGDERHLGVYWSIFETIFINSGRHLVPWEQVELHETVHYVLDKKDNVTFCQSEETARVVTARVFNREVSESWRSAYRCPAR